MNEYNQALEFFVENRICLDETQLEALQEKFGAKLSSKLKKITGKIKLKYAQKNINLLLKQIEKSTKNKDLSDKDKKKLFDLKDKLSKLTKEMSKDYNNKDWKNYDADIASMIAYQNQLNMTNILTNQMIAQQNQEIDNMNLMLQQQQINQMNMDMMTQQGVMMTTPGMGFM